MHMRHWVKMNYELPTTRAVLTQPAPFSPLLLAPNLHEGHQSSYRSVRIGQGSTVKLTVGLRRRCAWQCIGGCAHSTGVWSHPPQLWQCGAHPAGPLRHAPDPHGTPPPGSPATFHACIHTLHKSKSAKHRINLFRKKQFVKNEKVKKRVSVIGCHSAVVSPCRRLFLFDHA